MTRIIKFIALSIAYISLVLVIFTTSPFIVAVIEIYIFQPSSSNIDWIIWLSIQTVLVSFVNIIICENIRIKMFSDYNL